MKKIIIMLIVMVLTICTLGAVTAYASSASVSFSGPSWVSVGKTYTYTYKLKVSSACSANANIKASGAFEIVSGGDSLFYDTIPKNTSGTVSGTVTVKVKSGAGTTGKIYVVSDKSQCASLNFDSSGNISGDPSVSSVSGSITASVLATPSLTAKPASYNSIKLSWSKVSSAGGYRVYRATSSSGTYTRVATITSGSTLSYTDTGRTTGKAYYYKIVAYRTVDGTNVYSGYSSTKSAKTTLSKPSITAAPASYSSVKVSWKAVPGASGYNVYRATSSSGPYSLLKTTASTSYTSTGLTTGKTYYYKVKPYRSVSGSSVYGSYSSAKSAKPILATPSITAASAGYSSVKVSWKAVSGASGYNVYRATSSSGPYSLLKTTKSTSYTSTGLTTGKTYYYKVKPYRAVSGSSVFGSYSSAKSAKPIPAVPSGVKAAKASSTSIKVSWSSVSGASRYQVYRATSKTGTYTKVKATSSKSYTDTGLTNDKTYYYKVRAYTTVNGTRVYGSYSSIVYYKL